MTRFKNVYVAGIRQLQRDTKLPNWCSLILVCKSSLMFFWDIVVVLLLPSLPSPPLSGTSCTIGMHIADQWSQATISACASFYMVQEMYPAKVISSIHKIDKPDVLQSTFDGVACFIVILQGLLCDWANNAEYILLTSDILSIAWIYVG